METHASPEGKILHTEIPLHLLQFFDHVQVEMAMRSRLHEVNAYVQELTTNPKTEEKILQDLRSLETDALAPALQTACIRRASSTSLPPSDRNRSVS